jgi:hypothetical protein
MKMNLILYVYDYIGDINFTVKYSILKTDVLSDTRFANSHVYVYNNCPKVYSDRFVCSYSRVYINCSNGIFNNQINF